MQYGEHKHKLHGWSWWQAMIRWYILFPCPLGYDTAWRKIDAFRFQFQVAFLVQIFTSCTNFIELYFAFRALRRFPAIPCYNYWITECCKNPNFGAIRVWPIFKNMFVAREIHAEHKDLIHDVSYDYHGRRMATCSSDQSVKVSARNINCRVCQNLLEQKLWNRA